MYTASKVFTTYLAESLSFEWRDKVDVISYRPASVNTNMNPDDRGDPGFITPERAAYTCFRDLGLQGMTYGHHGHHSVANLINLFSHGMKDGPSDSGMRKEWEGRYKKKEGELTTINGDQKV